MPQKHTNRTTSYGDVPDVVRDIKRPRETPEERHARLLRLGNKVEQTEEHYLDLINQTKEPGSNNMPMHPEAPEIKTISRVSVPAKSPKPTEKTTEKNVNIMVSGWPNVTRVVLFELTEDQYRQLMTKDSINSVIFYLADAAPPANINKVRNAVFDGSPNTAMAVFRLKPDWTPEENGMAWPKNGLSPERIAHRPIDDEEHEEAAKTKFNVRISGWPSIRYSTLVELTSEEYAELTKKKLLSGAICYLEEILPKRDFDRVFNAVFHDRFNNAMKVSKLNQDGRPEKLGAVWRTAGPRQIPFE
ncbi:hypothetical protein M1329_00485 [Candidatus Marsarchaeota archaeon]|nr:hypothetical protein [Candidatus Marsarchaeota archaeon]MCL5099906.1 hypothetical protein [Candidatus Marsarchaeota archaeon]